MFEDFGLERFVRAQDAHSTYARALAELEAGRKQSHWMWFIFPQLAGLGSSSMSVTYALSSLPEARAYLEHPVLGPRLLACTRTVAAIQGRSAAAIFGSIDARKLHSSMTLFNLAAPQHPEFAEVLRQYFGGADDPVTQRLLAR